MHDVVPHLKLTAAGARRILHAAMAKRWGVPQCIAVVDDGGNLLAFIRMDGAKLQSIEACQYKAITAASHRVRTGLMQPDIGFGLGLASQGKFVNAKGGVPIIIDGRVIGGIGVGSGKNDEDLEVALAGVAALPGATSGA